MPLRSGLRGRRVTHNSNNIFLEEIEINNSNNKNNKDNSNSTAPRTSVENTHGNISQAQHIRWKNHARTLHNIAQRL